MISPELTTRIATGLAMGTGAALLLVLAAVMEEGSWILTAAAFLVNGMCAFEFGRVCIARLERKDRVERIIRRLIYSSVVFIPAAVLFGVLSVSGDLTQSGRPEFVLPLILRAFLISCILTGVYAMLRGRRSLGFTERVAKDLPVGLFLIGLCGACLVGLAAGGASWRPVLWVIAVVCATDIGAYFAGKRIGGPKLAPFISPNKTISGSIGGLLAGAAAGAAGAGLIAVIPWIEAVALAVAAAAASQLGDLCKSYVKRVHEVKDTGTLFPGHGGMLDRVDGLLLGSAVVYLWIL